MRGTPGSGNVMMRVDADDISRDIDAGAPPRLGQGHPSCAARRSDPFLAEGQGCGSSAPLFQKEASHVNFRSG